MKLGRGHIADVPDVRDWPLQRLLPGVAVTAAAVDFTDRIDRVRDQGATNSCVGQAFTNAIYLRAQLMGLAIPHPSASAAYTLGRSFRSPAPDELLDLGAFPRDVVDAMAEFGVVSEGRWPFDESKVNERLPWDVLEAGADAIVTGYSRVFGDPVEGAKAALSSGYPVPFAMRIYENYEEMGPGLYTAPAGALKGSHMQCMVGYRPGMFHVLNTWGTGWGDGGLVWLAESFVASDEVMDLYAVTIAPAGVH